jgi:hypothetical protein
LPGKLIGLDFIASPAVTNAESHIFLEDDAYRRTELWHSAGWAIVKGAGLDRGTLRA